MAIKPARNARKNVAANVPRASLLVMDASVSCSPCVERAVLAAPGQLVELLPGWAPLAS